MILADCPELRSIPWRCVVIDEAHRLKNRNCKLLEGLKMMDMVSGVGGGDKIVILVKNVFPNCLLKFNQICIKLPGPCVILKDLSAFGVRRTSCIQF